MRNAVLGLLMFVFSAPLAGAQMTGQVGRTEQKRIQNAAEVLREMKEIPPDIWQKANCVGVIPSLKKAAFMFGGEYGKGVISCRTANGWSAPAFYQLEKGSWGLQIGGQTIDLVFLVMNQKGIEHLLQSKFVLGGSGSVAAGPIGRQAGASTDVQMRAEILSYSRSQGLFAGIDLSGGALMPDKDANADLYGQNTNARDILLGNKVKAPGVTKPFIAALVQTSREAQGQPAIK